LSRRPELTGNLVTKAFLGPTSEANRLAGPVSF